MAGNAGRLFFLRMGGSRHEASFEVKNGSFYVSLTFPENIRYFFDTKFFFHHSGFVPAEECPPSGLTPERPAVTAIMERMRVPLVRHPQDRRTQGPFR